MISSALRRPQLAAGADSAAPSSSAPSDDGGNSAERGGDPGTPTPWEIMLYITKKRERRTNALGEIVVGADTLAEPMNWSGDAQLGLATKASGTTHVFAASGALKRSIALFAQPVPSRCAPDDP